MPGNRHIFTELIMLKSEITRSCVLRSHRHTENLFWKSGGVVVHFTVHGTVTLLTCFTLGSGCVIGDTILHGDFHTIKDPTLPYNCLFVIPC